MVGGGGGNSRGVGLLVWGRRLFRKDCPTTGVVAVQEQMCTLSSVYLPRVKPQVLKG